MRFPWRIPSLPAKLLMLLLLLLLLGLPLDQVSSLVRERSDNRNSAVAELAQTFTHDQILSGPMLVVPHTETWTETISDSKKGTSLKRTRSQESFQLVYPETLRLDGELLPETRYRGIFEAMFYRLGGRLTGEIKLPNLPSPQHTGGVVVRGKPAVVVAVSDVRGIEGMPTLRLGGVALEFKAGLLGVDNAAHENGLQGIHAPFDLATVSGNGKTVPFELNLTLVGQSKLAIVPLAEQTEAHLKSPWPHPSFSGQYLASERSIGDQGFDAKWRVASLVSSAQDQFGRVWAGTRVTRGEDCDDEEVACAAAPLTRAASGPRGYDGVEHFAVSLEQPLDVYFLTHRAAKYGALFIGLVLMAAFMYELLVGLRLHPIQYALVGLSIAVFFLLLLGLSEKLAFAWAYAASASASVALLAAYFVAVLQGWKRGLGLGAFCAVLYAALYVLLASERNALLLGALLTFGMLALLMLLTRRVNWWNLSSGSTDASQVVNEPVPPQP